jgi:hypothetical protein
LALRLAAGCARSCFTTPETRGACPGRHTCSGISGVGKLPMYRAIQWLDDVHGVKLPTSTKVIPFALANRSLVNGPCTRSGAEPRQNGLVVAASATVRGMPAVQRRLQRVGKHRLRARRRVASLHPGTRLTYDWYSVGVHPCAWLTKLQGQQLQHGFQVRRAGIDALTLSCEPAQPRADRCKTLPASIFCSSVGCEIRPDPMDAATIEPA